MNKAVPWNIRGVGFEAREAARLAARRAGVPVNEWLESVISAQAGILDPQSTQRLAEPASPSIGTRQPLGKGAGERWSDDESLDATFRHLEDRLTALSSMLDGGVPATPVLGTSTSAVPKPQPVSGAADRRLAEPVSSPAQDRSRPKTSLDEIMRRQAKLDLDATLATRQRAAADADRSDRAARLALNENRTEGFDARGGSRLDQAIRRQSREHHTFRSGVSTLSSDIAILAKHIRDLEAGSRRSDQNGMAERLDGLRAEIAALSREVGNLKAQPNISSLETAVRDLAGRVESSRLDGVQNSVLAPVEKLSAEIREAIASIDSRDVVQDLDRQLKILGRKVEAMAQQSVDPAALSAVQEQTREVREAFAAAALTPSVTDRIELELGKLGARVDRVADMPPRAANRDLERAVGEIRALLENFSPQAVVARIDQGLAHLAERIDHVAERQTPQIALFEDLSRRIDQGYASLQDRLSQTKAEPSQDMSALTTMVGALSRQVEDIRTSSTEVKNLDGLVRGLMTRIDDARNPNADERILDALEAQVGRLAERLDRSEHSMGAIANVQASISDLVQQLQDTQSVAETAARSATEDALRSALSAPGLGSSESRGIDIERELAGIRRAQEAGEHRVTSTLTALGTTLDRLVDHLSRQVDGGPARRAVAEFAEEAAQPVRRASSLLAPAEPVRLAGRTADAATPSFAADDLDGPVPRRTVPSVDIGDRDHDTAPDVSPLIAAARRAAHAAQTSAAAMHKARRTTPAGRLGGSKVSGFLAEKRRPLLLGLASLVLILGALQIVKLSGSRSEPAAVAYEQSAQPSSEDARPTPARLAAMSDPATKSATATATKAASTDAPSPMAPTKTAAAGPASDIKPILSDPALAPLPAGLRGLALQGDPAAQYEVALRLADGRGLTRDTKAAAAWFERAANQGLAPAEYRLASMYEKGLGVGTDQALAVNWYDKASSAGNIRAMHNLAVMLAEGAGGKPDYNKASGWFSKAANFGVRDSQYNLAILYARGLGLTQSLSQSYTWFSIAASQGDADAAKKRDEVAAKLDEKTLADAKAAADRFKPLTADKSANDVAPPPGGWDAVSPAKTVPGTAWRSVRPTSLFG